jgi:hypothetical protein
MLFMMKQKIMKYERIETTASVRMPIKSLDSGQYVGIAFLNLLSYWKKGNRAPSKKQLQIKVRIGNEYYAMLPGFYDFIRLISRQSTKARLNNRSNQKLTIHDKKTWNYWLKLKKKQEELLKKK